MGEALVTFWEALELAAYNSFYDTGHTYVSQAKGAETRIDVLAGPRRAMPAGRITSTRAMRSMAACYARIPKQHLADHLPIAAKIDYTFGTFN